MGNDIRDTKLFEFISLNSESIEKERVAFNDEISALLNNKTDELGSILKCHLIIEHFIDEFLIVAYPTIKNIDKIRFTFNQKLEFINNSNTVMEMTFVSLKSLNTLRNKYSHQLAYQIKEEDYKEIRTSMTAWYDALNRPLPEGIELIEHFTIWICANLNIMIQGIKTKTPELGISGYIEWLKTLSKSE